MLFGIYHVTFQSSLATVGDCYAVFDACGVHGANENHVFRGLQTCGGDEPLRLILEIRHLHGEKYPSFGALDAVNVDLEVIDETSETFRALGDIREARGIRLTLMGRKLADLAA
ncbi:MAG: hypothetical protein HY916_05145 [Desulfovibrio sp.]|jgi:hypothetical protein|nr:hypothetical protein [Desulfovibrio sp.]